MKVKKVVVYLSVALLVGAMIYAFLLMRKVFTPNTNFEQAKEYVYIPSDASPQQAMDSIKNVIKDWDLFYQVFTQFDMDKKIIPGRFEIRKGMNNYEIAQALQKNYPVRVTFNNKERLEDLVEDLASKLEPSVADFYQVFTDSVFLKENGLTKEQALAAYMPNTYEFYWNVSPLKVRQQIHKQYIRFWNKEREAKAQALGLTKGEVVSLAAIVQKESSKVDERSKIAGAYLNRIKKGMPLQADPTAIYAKKLTMNNFDTIIKRVYLNYTKLDNPYNTYKYKGVPPGPIMMPDEVSIDAVLNPEKHNYIYFCASVTRFGYHEFAENLSQHAENRKKYIKWLNDKNIQ